MWSRRELKERAKNVLRGNYLKLLLVCIIVGILTGQSISNGTSNNNSYHEYGNGDYDKFEEDFKNAFTSNPIMKLFAFIFGSFFVIFIIVSLIFRFFISNQIYVGGIKYITEMNKYNEPEPVSSLLWTLKTGNFTKVFCTMFFRDLRIFLWSMLFIIPGVIKLYEYYFISFILADNPSIDRRRAFEISKIMTDGQKMDIFILTLSFLPFTLITLFFPITTVFLMPYTLSTDAQLYLTVKQEVINSGMVYADELEFKEY